MRKESKFILLLFLLSILSLDVYGARRFWIGAVSNSWKNTANWSATSGGTGGASIPGSNDTASFNGLSTFHRCNLDSLVNVKRLTISGDTLSQGTYPIALGSSGANLTGGVFLGGSANINVSGLFTLAGTAFTSTSGTFSTSANFTFNSGTFAHNNGMIKFTATNSVTSASGLLYLYKLEYAPAATSTYTIVSGTTIIVADSLIMSGASSLSINDGIINVKGNILITNSNGNSNGDAIININGAGKQTLRGTDVSGKGRLPKVIINKTSDTLWLENYILVTGNWTHTAGIVMPGASTVFFVKSNTIAGSLEFNNLMFYGGAAYTYTISSGTTLTVKGTLTFNGAFAITLNTGTIHAKGNITINNTGTGGGGNAALVVNGDGDQIITGSGAAGQGRLPKITINKTSGTLYLNSVISVIGDWIYTNGTVVPSYFSMGALLTSTVVLYGAGNLDGTGSTTMSFYNLIIGSNTRTLTGNIDVNNNLSINSATTLSAGSNSIYCGGNWTNTGGTWTYGTSTVIFDGAAYREIKRTSGGSAATETFYNLSFNRSGGSQKLASPVTVNNVLTLTKGHVKSDTTNYLLLIDNATLVGGSDSAYVHGPVRKTGDDAFVFPLGDTTLADTTAYHPLGISAPAVNTDQFEATYFALAQTYGDSLVDSLGSISNCEYWTLERKVGSSNVSVTGTWNSNSCNISDYQGLRLAQWNGTYWDDLGVSSIAVTDRQGTITSPVVLSFPISLVPIVIGRPKPLDQYAVMRRKLDGGYYQVNNGALFFRFDDEYNDADELLTFNVYNNMNNLVTTNTSLPAAMQLSVYFGDNRYKLNTLNCHFTASGSLPTGFYILEVINEKNEHWFLRFYNNTNNITVSCPTNDQG